MDHQTFEPVATSRQTNKQKTSNRNNFSDHNQNLFANSKTTKSSFMNSQNQSRAQNFNRNVPQQAPHTVFSNDQPRGTLDSSKIYPFFQQNKNMTIKHHIRNQPHYSADEEYHNQNKQRFNTNQPDLFEPYTRNEQTRQTRRNPTSNNNNFQSQNPVNKQSYQPTQMQNEIPLPNCLQQHEVTESQFNIFSQIPNAAK